MPAVGPGTLAEPFDSSGQVMRPTSQMIKNICKNQTWKQENKITIQRQEDILHEEEPLLNYSLK